MEMMRHLVTFSARRFKRIPFLSGTYSYSSNQHTCEQAESIARHLRELGARDVYVVHVGHDMQAEEQEHEPSPLPPSHDESMEDEKRG